MTVGPATPLDPATLGGLAPRQPPPRVLFALKHADCFVVADSRGDIEGVGDGMFRNDTRVLSLWRLTLGDETPSELGTAISQDNALFTAHLTNTPLPPLGGQSTPEGVLHINRTRLIWEERLYERILLTNYGDLAIVVPMEISFAADFRDMFEVRGATRQRRGRLLDAQIASPTAVVLGYEGLDLMLRHSVVSFSPAPADLAPNQASFKLALPQHGRAEVYFEVGPDSAATPSKARFRAAAARLRVANRTNRRRGARVVSSGRLFNGWIERSRSDLAMLTTELATGPYPYAGIPWFSTTFGRDAIVTALQMLWLDPGLARGVLRFLAHHQAQETSTFADAAPGKIMHERRKGEMVALRELPFERYYGGVDTTPLFVMLAGAYSARTGDIGLIEELWPALLRAIAWIEGDGDSNRDGLIDYARGAATGLANQGWKDSHDSVFHADGSQPLGPIALVEVQAYAFAAFAEMAALAARRPGAANDVTRWRQRAEAIRSAVESRFWSEELGTYALALDGEGRACRIRSSNAGHLLFTGLPSAERARQVASQLLSNSFNSGWGIRTLAVGEARFNPMSYHNGSVWPHDTALCAAGLARYGYRDGVVRLLSQTFEAAVHFDMRLPELFCGFQRVTGTGPIGYPVACLPQAWSAGALFMILQACLGLRIDGWTSEVHVDRPQLPVGMDSLTISRLQVGATWVDITFKLVGDRVMVTPQPCGTFPMPPISVHT